MKFRGMLVVGLVLWDVAGHAVAQATRTIDLRKMSDVEGNFSVAFCARPSPDTALKLPGHMFVTYSLQDKSGNRTFRAIGHTTSDPGGALLSYSKLFSPASGYLKEEVYTDAMQRCLEVYVNKADYDSAWKLSTSPLAKLGITDSGTPLLLAYRLGAEDCMGFALGVAKLFQSRGLVIPTRGSTEIPLMYMRRLIDANAPK